MDRNMADGIDPEQGNAAQQIDEPTPESDSSVPRITEDEALEVLLGLEQLDWSRGLTRDRIKRRYHELPEDIYLRLPASKVFRSPEEVLAQAGIAPSRAEGEFLGRNPDLPARDSVENGGPPAWGAQPGIYAEHASLEGGSSEDTEGLEQGNQGRSS